jgi:succinoglycan biosynthesis transport protein ExoP
MAMPADFGLAGADCAGTLQGLDMLNNLSLRYLSYLLFKRWRVFCGSVVVALVLYTLLVLTKPSQYESTASIVVKVIDQDLASPDAITQQQGVTASSFSTLAKEVINSIQVIITSPDVLASTLKVVGVERVYPKIGAQTSRGGLPMINVAVETLLTDLTVKVNNDTNVLTLSLFNTNPLVARASLQALVSATVAKHATVMRDPRLQFLERKLASLKIEADAAQQAVLEFKQKAGISSFDEERSLLLKQRDVTQNSRNEIQANLFASSGRARSLEDSLQHTPRAIVISDENDRMQRQVDTARDRLTSATARYEAARQRFREGNPELVDQAAQLDSARHDFERLSQQSSSRVRTGANPVSQALSQTFATSRSDVDAMRAALQERAQQLTAIDERLSHLNANETRVRELERRRDLAEREYRSYLERAQSARIVSDMNEAGLTSLSVLQPPTLAYVPARPRKMLLLLMALLAGLAGGLALCIFLETLDDTMALPEQVETIIGLPLLAVVNSQGQEDSR